MTGTRLNSRIRRSKIFNSSTESFTSDKQDKSQFQLPFYASHCIFCAAECSAKFMVHDGKITRIKDETNNSLIERQLKSFFIVRNILGVNQKSSHELLSQWDGQLNPEFWIHICLKCNEFVEIYSENFIEIAKRIKEADLVKGELKRAIWESSQWSSDEENEDTAFSGVWKEIREQALIGFEPSQVVHRGKSEKQTKTVVKVEQDDLNCTISLILILFLLILDNGNETDISDTESVHHPPPSPSTSCIRSPKQSPQHAENDLNDKLNSKSFYKKDVKKIGTNPLEHQNEPETDATEDENDTPIELDEVLYMEEDSSSDFSWTSSMMTSDDDDVDDVYERRGVTEDITGNHSLITEHEGLSMEPNPAVFVNENSSDSSATLTASENGDEDDDDFCEVICVKSKPPVNERQTPQTNIKEIFSSIYTKLRRPQLNKRIPGGTDIETTVQIGISALNNNTRSQIHNENTRVPIAVSRANGNVTISRNPEPLVQTEIVSIHPEPPVQTEIVSIHPEPPVEPEIVSRNPEPPVQTEMLLINPEAPVEPEIDLINPEPPEEPEIVILNSMSIRKEEEFRCTKCPAKFSNLKEFKSHCILHLKGVPAEACGDCGVFVHCARYLFHRSVKCSNTKGTRTLAFKR